MRNCNAHHDDRNGNDDGDDDDEDGDSCRYFIDNVQNKVKWFGLGTQMRAHMKVLTYLQILTVQKRQKKESLLTKTGSGTFTLKLVLKAVIMVFMSVASQIIFMVECLSTLLQISKTASLSRPLADERSGQRRRHGIHVISLSMNG